ncbi:MAG: MerR family transcriptional regulator [Solirubrobacteraceae bacterium]
MREDMLKMSELVEYSGVSAATIKHYLREGLLPEPVRTSRNMAYYPKEFAARIKLIKRLQAKRFMPLQVIRRLLSDDPKRLAAMLELEDRIVEQALSSAGKRISAAEVGRRYEIPRAVLDRLAELGVLTPHGRGYDADDVKIIEAVGRFRAGGYDETLGFTVYDTIRYRDALAPLVAEEVSVLLGRLAGEVEVERAIEIVRAGSEPLRELIGAMHSKMLLTELSRTTSARDGAR